MNDDLQKIKCPYCGSTPIDAWYTINYHKQKRFWIRCICPRRIFSIDLAFSKGLNFTVRSTGRREHKPRRQDKLL